jgi:acetyltransferase-like isoleucine patch superfamily enzyme
VTSEPVPAVDLPHSGTTVDDTQPPVVDVRRPPEPPRGTIAFLRFARRHGMLRWRYARIGLRVLRLKLRFGRRLQIDGPAFVGRRVTFEIGPRATVRLGRWSWLGDGTKVRCHEGEVVVGAKSVLGQECTISCYERVEIGRECVIADRSMFIDFDHSVAWVDTPIREQGIYTRPVRVGHNVWIGYGGCVLRGVTVGDNSVLGTYGVATRDLPENSVAGGVPAKVIRLRDAPQRMRWAD